MSSPIGTLGNVNNIAVDELQAFVPNGSSLKMLGAQMIGNAQCSTFRDFSSPATSNAGYTPSGSNLYYCLGFQVFVVSGGATADVRLGYGDTDVGFGSASLPTAPWGIGHGTITNLADAANMFDYSPAMAQTTGQYYARQKSSLYIPFPNGKYPLVLWNNNLSAGSGILMFGYEAP